MPRDKELNCKELKDEYSDTRRFKQEALDVQSAPGAQTARSVFFWPALLVTLHNGDKAINAANERAYHIVDIMKKKIVRRQLIFLENLQRQVLEQFQQKLKI